MTTALPSNMSYGQIVHRMLFAVADGSDSGRDPDAVPIVGAQITFTPSVGYLLNATAVPPTTIYPQKVLCVTDPDGYLVDPLGVRGVWLVASDDPDLNPSDFTYSVEIKGSGLVTRTFSIAVPGGVTTDLTTVMPVSTSFGNPIVVGPRGPAGITADLVEDPENPGLYQASDPEIVDRVVSVSDTFEFPDPVKDVLKTTFALNDGRVIHTGAKTRTAMMSTINAAEALGKGRIVYFPAGIYDVGNGLSLSGKSVQIRGDGAAGVTAALAGTVFWASTQTGPVIDFTGWVLPGNFQGRLTHEGFSVRGSGVADPTKNNAGVRLTAMSSATFRDIAVRDTGGPAWEHASNPGNGVYLCDFERIILSTPVGAKTNDVAYMTMDESNGNRFRGIGFRSITASADIGVSGALRLYGNASFAPHDNLFDGCWFEYAHVPDTGTLIYTNGAANVHADWQFFDCGKESGATGTSFFRFTDSPKVASGGNIVRGAIPGKGTGALELDMGIDMQQPRNSVTGVKGYRGTQVVIAAGVGYTFVQLGGAVSGSSDPAVIDNSGVLTNTIIDHYSGVQKSGARTMTEGANSYTWDNPGGAWLGGPRFSNVTTPANGHVSVGTSGTRLQAIGVNAYLYGDAHFFRTIAGTPTTVYLGSTTASPSIRSGTGSPEGVGLYGPGSLYLRTDGIAGACLYIKESAGATSTGWVPAGGKQRTAQALAANGAVTLALTTGNALRVNLAANATSSTITGAYTGARLAVEWAQDATGGRTYVWPTTCRFAGGTAPNTTTASTMTRVEFEYDGALWLETARSVAVPTA